MAPFHEALATQVETLKQSLAHEHEIALDILREQNAVLRAKVDAQNHEYKQLLLKCQQLQPVDFVPAEREALCEFARQESGSVPQNQLAAQSGLTSSDTDGACQALVFRPGHRWASLVEQALLNEARLEEARMLDEFFSMRMHGAWRTSLSTAKKSRASIVAPAEVPRSSVKHHLGAEITDDYHERWQKMILSPASNLRLGWLILGMFFIFVDILVIPLSIFDIGDHPFFKVQQLVSWLFWLCDVFVSFLSGFDRNGRIEMRPIVIARKYLKTMFPIDVFILSIDVVMFALDASLGSEAGALRTTRIIRSLRLLRLLRLLRVGKLRAILKACEKRLRNPYSVLLLKLSSALATVLLINHFIACGWYYVGLEGHPDRNWILLSDLEGFPFAEVYISAMHWSLTQFMPATNNIGPDNVWERLFAIMTVLVAVCLFSSLVGSITAAVGSFRAVQAEKMKQEQAVVAFFEERKLSAELFDDMREHQRESQKGKEAVADVTTKMSDIRLFRECPESLKLRLSEEVFMPAFDSPGWVQTDILTTGFLYKVCHTMREQVETPGKDVFLPDQMASLAFFVASGTLSFAESQGTLQKRIIGSAMKVLPGTWLCEPVLWAQWFHRGQFWTTSTSVLMCLDSAKFVDLAVEAGGSTYEFLFMFGIVYVGRIEALCSEGKIVTDLGLEASQMDDLADRSRRFLSAQTRSLMKQK
ncbi:unnamed protein product [Durusdinium trenchii]|uniref:Ion transport domain-containing protein n=2 Tax=Durusdinium trenchii TaxID=1381693 RepID=A0ABP0NZG2_9DINO